MAIIKFNYIIRIEYAKLVLLDGCICIMYKKSGSFSLVRVESVRKNVTRIFRISM